MRIRHLNCSTFCPAGGAWVDGRTKSVLRPGRLVCHVLLVETAAHGLVLVDTGLGLDDLNDPRRLGSLFLTFARPTLDEGETALRQVEALGYKGTDVRHIILTHMDLDHAGGLADFPAAVVHVTRAEHSAALAPSALRERHRYRPVQFAHSPRFETYEPDGEAWFGFEAVRSLVDLPPEILLVPLSGHSRGHAAVAVETPAGWLLHAGDAYFHADEMDPERPRCPIGLRLFQNVVATDRRQMRRNKERLRQLLRERGTEEVTVFSAHDEVELARLRRERTDDAASAVKEGRGSEAAAQDGA